ncbi:MAG TPA: ABC transporter substrate binding protein [Candidatus Acidoferrum sp.]|nr:ABC transporter substrate binding protein [Candidatus Acidoferrum sp.]
MLALIPLALLSALPLGATERSKTVLAIYDQERLLPANMVVDSVLRDSLGLETDNPPTYLSEFLDVSRFGSSDYDKLLSDFFRSKYAGQQIDVIVAGGALALQFLRRHQADLFTGIPVVFCGVSRESFESQTLPPNFVGVPIAIETLPTFELALHLQPDAREIVIVTGASEVDRMWEARLRRDLPHLQTSVPIRYLSGQALDDLLRELSRLPPNSFVYSPGLLRDGAGRTYIPRKVLRRMADASTAPVYGFMSTDVGSGIVGGYMVTMEDVGRQAAGLVQKILDGEKLSQADAPSSPPAHYVFDWNQLQRWHIPEKKLPPGSIVLYRDLGAWQRYKRYIIVAIFVVFAETLLVLALLWQRARRRKVEAELHESQDRLKGIVASATDAIIAIDDAQRIVLFNVSAEKMFNCRAQEAVGSPIERFIPQRFRAAHSTHIRQFGETGETNRAMGTLGTLWALRANGDEFPIEVSISQVDTARKKLFTVILRDITERKRTEGALRESEQRFRLVADTAPALIWMSGTDKLCIFFNKGWLDFTGRTMEEELGEGWAAGVHPDDLEYCLGTYSGAFDARMDFELEYRLRRFDGEYRWLVDYGVPRFETDGTFCGYIGSCVDITERKSSEESLQNLSGRLIRAHEEERARIARELHDDFSQRLALLGIGLGQLWNELPESEVQERIKLLDMLKGTQEMSSDLHALSHQLHSSRLEHVGLVPALNGLCKELGEKYKIEVHFAAREFALSIPKDVQLCLFRVTQEALGNVVKHSQAKSAEVELGTNANGISLRITDAGRGFEPDLSNPAAGIGLVGMRERLRLVGGRLTVKAELMRGTEVLAEVPLASMTGQGTSEQKHHKAGA